LFETKKEDSDLKIIDFGLSKIIKCTQFGEAGLTGGKNARQMDRM